MQSVLGPLIGPAKPTIPNISGRTAIITGGALGIGFEIAYAMALSGCRVIMLNRKEEQGEAAIAKIKENAVKMNLPEGGKKVDVEWRGVDLGDFKQTGEVFRKLAESEERLDYLILSAGINTNQFGLAASGIDRHMSVNAIGHFYAINLLYPLLRKTSKLPDTPAPRIIFESSEMHRFAPSKAHYGSVEELNDDSIDPTQLYGRTKLAMILYTKKIVEKVVKPNGDNIYVSAVHPGAVNTDMQKQWEDAYPGVMGTAIKTVTEFFGRAPEQGSYSALWAAFSPEIVEKNYQGVYIQDPGKVGGETKQAQDGWLAESLWQLSERIIRDKVGSDALGPWN